MKDTRFGEPIVHQFLHALPGEAILLAAPPKRASPEVGHCMPERPKCPAVCGNCKVGQVPENDLPQPFPLFRDCMVHSAPSRKRSLAQSAAEVGGGGFRVRDVKEVRDLIVNRQKLLCLSS